MVTASVIIVTAVAVSAAYLFYRSRAAARPTASGQPDELVDQNKDECSDSTDEHIANQDPADVPFSEDDSRTHLEAEIVEEIEDAIRGVQSSFENLDDVVRETQNDVNESTADDCNKDETEPHLPKVDNPESEITKKRLSQKASTKTAVKAKSPSREPSNGFQRQAQVSRVTDEAMQAIVSLFVQFENLADNESTRQKIREGKSRILDSHREKTPEETFSACRQAFRSVNEAFLHYNDSEVHVAITEVLTAIDIAIQKVAAGFRLINDGEQFGARIAKAIIEATKVIRAATAKIKQVIEAQSETSGVPDISPQSVKDSENRSGPSDVFQTQKVTVQPEVELEREEVRATFRAKFATSRQNHSFEIDDSSVLLIKEFLAKIESRIDDEIHRATEDRSMATLKREVETARKEFVRSASTAAEATINEIAKECKKMILSRSTNRANAHAVTVSKICMMATKSMLIEEIVESVVYSYEGGDVQEVKQTVDSLVMRYIKDVAETKFNRLLPLDRHE